MLSFLFLQSESPTKGDQESRSFLIENEQFEKYFKKKFKNILSVQKNFVLLHSQTKTERFLGL